MKRVDVPAEFLSNRAAGDVFELPEDTSHYVANVLRRTPGDRLELFDGSGNRAVVSIDHVGDSVRVEILTWERADSNESPLTTTLFQAIPKGKRWKWILEKATELGVDNLVPLHTERTVKKIPADRLPGRLDRWERKLSAAARQCQRALVPSVVEPHRIERALGEHACDTHLVADPDADASGVVSVLQKLDQPTSVGIWIGPEGGFTAEEVDRLLASPQTYRIQLGPRILRADTAGITTLTLIQAVFGDL